MRGVASVIAEKTKTEQHVIYEELKANLVPGVILQPTGVYAVHRAQEAGCTFIRST
jgi:intracellular sulfur oxidation DsrE/DsrF family protein